MPIRGIVCEHTGEDVTIDYCLNCARSWHNPCHFIYPVVKHIVNDFDRSSHRDTEIHVTDITSPCIRNVVIQKLIDYTVRLTDRIYLIDGTMVHKLIESVSDSSYKQEQDIIWTTQDGTEILGTYDILTNSGILIDIKTSRGLNPKWLPRDEHVWQLNIYRVILNHNIPSSVKTMEAIYKDMNGPQKCKTCRGKLFLGEHAIPTCSRERCGKKYPNAHSGYIRIDIPRYDDEDIICMIEMQARIIKDALDNKIIPEIPSKLADWVCSYCAVKKECHRLESEGL